MPHLIPLLQYVRNCDVVQFIYCLLRRYVCSGFNNSTVQFVYITLTSINSRFTVISDPAYSEVMLRLLSVMSPSQAHIFLINTQCNQFRLIFLTRQRARYKHSHQMVHSCTLHDVGVFFWCWRHKLIYGLLVLLTFIYDNINYIKHILINITARRPIRNAVTKRVRQNGWCIISIPIKKQK